MRVWHPIPPFCLDRQRLLGEHREIHAIARILMKERAGIRRGYSNHPEVKRWRRHIGPLIARHNRVVEEMERRGYKHKSPLDDYLDNDSAKFPEPWEPVERMRAKLAEKQAPKKEPTDAWTRLLNSVTKGLPSSAELLDGDPGKAQEYIRRQQDE